MLYLQPPSHIAAECTIIYSGLYTCGLMCQSASVQGQEPRPFPPQQSYSTLLHSFLECPLHTEMCPLDLTPCAVCTFTERKCAPCVHHFQTSFQAGGGEKCRFVLLRNSSILILSSLFVFCLQTAIPYTYTTKVSYKYIILGSQALQTVEQQLY